MGCRRRNKHWYFVQSKQASYPPCREPQPFGLPCPCSSCFVFAFQFALKPSLSLCCECHDCSLCQEKAFRARLMWHLFGNMRERALKINLEMASYKFGFPVLIIYRAHIGAHCLMHKYNFFVTETIMRNSAHVNHV